MTTGWHYMTRGHLRQGHLATNQRKRVSTAGSLMYCGFSRAHATNIRNPLCPRWGRIWEANERFALGSRHGGPVILISTNSKTVAEAHGSSIHGITGRRRADFDQIGGAAHAELVWGSGQSTQGHHQQYQHQREHVATHRLTFFASQAALDTLSGLAPDAPATAG